MSNHFNAASLATLSKAELQSLLRTYTQECSAPKSQNERDETEAKIAAVRTALSLKYGPR